MSMSMFSQFSNLGEGKNGGNNISGSDMPTTTVDLEDQHCRDISGWAVTQRSRFDYMHHCILGAYWNLLLLL